MSVTTTDNPITLSLQQTLGDYEVHVTGDNNGERAGIDSLNTSNQSQSINNPPNWPQDYHRMPNHRPINRHLKFSERPGGSNPVEQVFITTMFAGVALNAGVAQLWGMSGGKVFTRVFRYAIGGEW